MELKQIKELMTAMSRTGTKRLEIRESTFELILERHERGLFLSGETLEPQSIEEQFKTPLLNRTDQALSRGSDMPAARLPAAPAQEENVNSLHVKSPMVGTCYLASSPEAASFVKVGDRIDKQQVVCIIEAMKVMNEIKANLSGTIVEVLVESGQPVEFGTKLFRIVE